MTLRPATHVGLALAIVGGALAGSWLLFDDREGLPAGTLPVGASMLAGGALLLVLATLRRRRDGQA